MTAKAALPRPLAVGFPRPDVRGSRCVSSRSLSQPLYCRGRWLCVSLDLTTEAVAVCELSLTLAIAEWPARPPKPPRLASQRPDVRGSRCVSAAVAHAAYESRDRRLTFEAGRAVGAAAARVRSRDSRVACPDVRGSRCVSSRSLSQPLYCPRPLAVGFPRPDVRGSRCVSSRSLLR